MTSSVSHDIPPPDDGPDDAEVSIPSAAATAAPAKSRLRNAGSMTLVCSDCAAL